MSTYSKIQELGLLTKMKKKGKDFIEFIRKLHYLNIFDLIKLLNSNCGPYS